MSFLGSGDFLAPVVALTSLLLVWTGQGVSALGLVLGWASCGLTVEWLKWLMGRGRPPVPQLDYVVGAAFPSGHAAQSLYVYGYLWILFATSGRRGNASPRRKTYGRIVSLVFAVLPILVGLSRLYLGLHWPSDVLAGWGIGLFFSGVAFLTKP
ncbi:MAG: phosphatase PAP2 family protein [Acidobacteria bacterium]|nr:phosphatase PAP2 family protein [Acidobacteriota bacterium]